MKYTVIVPVKNTDYYLAEPVCEALNRQYSIEKIYIISKIQDIKSQIQAPYVETIDEDEIYEGLTFLSVKKVMESTDYLDPKLTGHCFQQLIKMAFCYKCHSEGYLVWDADTYPLRQIDFFDQLTKKTTFHMKSEYNKDYFDNLFKILKIHKQTEKSFISEHMFFECNIMSEIISEIETKDIKGNNWWEKIVYAMPCGNGMSEYEIYGNYMLCKYPEKCVLKDAKSLRYGKNVLGDMNNPQKMNWMAKSFDCVSFENWDKETILTKLSNLKFNWSLNPKIYSSVVSTMNRGINHFKRG